jgi:hypothetical protein
MTRKPLLIAALLIGFPAAALAQSDSAPQPRPELYEALLRCRAIAEPAAKLQCFEAATDSLEQAVERREVVVVDRAQVRESRRRLFGIALPRLPVFGGDGDDEEDEIDSVEGVVASASQDRNGRWIVRLEDGATWAQTDNNSLALRPRPGQKVEINRAALGTFMMRVNGQPGVRARRQL